MPKRSSVMLPGKGKRLPETVSFPRIAEKQTLIVAILYLLFTLTAFWPILTNVTHLVIGVNGSDDTYQSLWDLWWAKQSLLLTNGSSYSTNLLYYPLGTDLRLQTLFPIAATITIPLQGVSLAFAYNMIEILSIFLSAIFTYFLLMHLTKERLPSFLGGIVFAFSAVSMAHSYSFLDWSAECFMPLFTLFLLLVIRTNRFRYILGASISLVLISFMGNIEAGLMAVVFAIILVYFGIFSGLKKEILSRETLLSLAGIAAIAFIIALPLTLPLLQGILYDHLLSCCINSVSITSTIGWSNDLFSFLLPAQFNGIVNGVISGYQSIVSPYGAEGVAYIGYTVIFLSLIGIYYDFKRDELSNLILWISVGVFFAWLSLGPFIKVLGNTTSIPGIYLIYYLIPVLNQIREPGRFDLIVSLCLAVTSAFGMKYLIKAARITDSNQKILLTASFSILIFIECAGFPASQQFISHFYTNTSIPEGYYQISDYTNGTLLMLPNQPYSTYIGKAEYYQTASDKPIIGGYTTRITLGEFLYPYSIPLVSIYSFSGNGSVMVPYEYPIIENYTEPNLMTFSKYDIKYVSIIKNAYNQSTLESINSGIGELSGKIIYNDNSTEIYYMPGINASKRLNDTAFLSGYWLPGAYSTLYYTAPTNPELWWIVNAANITVYSQGSQEAAMCANLTSLVNASIAVYSNGALLNETKVIPGNYSYSVLLALHQGYNNLTFSTNNIGKIVNPTLSVGFRQIRFLYGQGTCT